MRYLLTERTAGNTSRWTLSGPFLTAAEAERSATAVLGTPTCLAARVMTLADLLVVDRHPVDHPREMAKACRAALDQVRTSVETAYPDTASMPPEIKADYLGDRADPRELVYRR